MAPYLKAMKYTRTRQPFYGNTFIYKVLDDLRYYGFNALVDGFMRNEHLDLCQRYGIAVWDRGRPRNHPVVLGALIGDEPTRKSMSGYVRDYKAAREARQDPDQLLLTNVIADGSLSCISNFFWDVIQPRHRFCRRKYLAWGAGPRACQSLLLGAKARALIDGRISVLCGQARTGHTSAG